LSSNLKQAREALGARLRELRRGSGLNGKEFAARLGWYGASRVSKLELGQQTPSEKDLVEWTTAAGVPDALPELRVQLNAIETFYNEWRRQLFVGIHARQLELVELNAETTTFRAFECAVVPGLLQTADYARCQFEFDATLYRVPAKVDEAVQMRLRMQDLLHARDKRFHFVLTEAALRYPQASRDVMLSQLDKLLVATTLRSVRLGVIPFGVLLEAGARHGFWIHDDRLVLVETFAAELRLTQPDEIALYGRVFDQMAAAAVYGAEARRVIAHVARTLDPPPGAPPETIVPSGDDGLSSDDQRNS
jgi:transcriptional regulator with XRE-family HTH domain